MACVGGSGSGRLFSHASSLLPSYTRVCIVIPKFTACGLLRLGLTQGESTMMGLSAPGRFCRAREGHPDNFTEPGPSVLMREQATAAFSHGPIRKSYLLRRRYRHLAGQWYFVVLRDAGRRSVGIPPRSFGSAAKLQQNYLRLRVKDVFRNVLSTWCHSPRAVGLHTSLYVSLTHSRKFSIRRLRDKASIGMDMK